MGLRYDELPTHEEMIRNIISVYKLCTETDVRNGMTWYKRTAKLITDIADANGIVAEHLVAVYAAISPALDKSENDASLHRIIKLVKEGVPCSEWKGFGAFPHNLRKAEPLLRGDLSVLRGRKVNAFFSNLLGNNMAVTVDRWAVRIVMNDPYLGRQKIAPSSNKCYRAIARAYASAAGRVGVSPRELQAITWEYYRRTYYGVSNPKGSLAWKYKRQFKDWENELNAYSNAEMGIVT